MTDFFFWTLAGGKSFGSSVSRVVLDYILSFPFSFDLCHIVYFLLGLGHVLLQVLLSFYLGHAS